MRTGYIISGIGHGLLMLWILFGGLFLRGPEEPPLRVSDVSLISGAEFAALTEAAAAPPPPTEPVPSPPETSPAPPPRPEPPAPEPPAPEPEPEPMPEPPAPEVTPPPADRVANEVIEAPEEPLPEGPALVEESTPEEVAEPDQPVEDLPAQAPVATTTQIVTEADRPETAPTSSPRPPRRPDRPAPPVPPAPPTETADAPDPAPTPDPAPAPADNAAIDSAVNDALADALGEAASAPGPSGPPLTSGERDGLRVAVSRCWNLGSASTDALNTTVVVLVQMARDGRPEGIEMVSSNGPNQEATRIAFEAARRAIIRCGTSGFGLPAEKYDQWREIEMTFDPGNMRIR